MSGIRGREVLVRVSYSLFISFLDRFTFIISSSGGLVESTPSGFITIKEIDSTLEEH